MLPKSPHFSASMPQLKWGRSWKPRAQCTAGTCIEAMYCQVLPRLVEPSPSHTPVVFATHGGQGDYNTVSMHIKTRYTPTTTHPTASQNPPLHTTNTNCIFVKPYLCKWWQNGTRCRDGVKSVVVSFPSSLVGF